MHSRQQRLPHSCTSTSGHSQWCTEPAVETDDMMICADASTEHSKRSSCALHAQKQDGKVRHTHTHTAHRNNYLYHSASLQTMHKAHHELESKFITISIITIIVIISKHAHTSLSAAFGVCKPPAAVLLVSDRGACSAPPPACRRTSMAYILPSASKLSCVPCSTMRPASMTMVRSAERTVDNLQRAHD